MHYQVSRNGQMYGPYTLDDLKRYVASGNILQTDMVKSETMADWIPVSQLLQTETNPFSTPLVDTAVPAAGTQPGGFTTPLVGDSFAPDYTAPLPAYAPAAVNASQYADPPNLNWGLYLLLTIVTCTLFSKVFVLIQAAWLKRVQPNSTALYFYIGMYVVWLISLFAGLGRMTLAMTHPGMFHRSPLQIVFTILYWVLLFTSRLVMNKSIEEHFNGPEPIGLQMNPVMAFFFGGVYFQSQFNRINAMKQAARYGSAPRPY